MGPTAAAERSRELLAAWANTDGRAVACRLTVDDQLFSFAVHGRQRFPAASLLKLPLAMAAEEAMAQGGWTRTAGEVVGEVRSGAPGALGVLAVDHRLSAAEILGLSLSLSDNDCAAWLYSHLGLRPVIRLVEELGCAGTTVTQSDRNGVGPLTGTTTADDALRLISAAADADRYPMCARALHNVVHASRIPLGVTDADVRLAHKTGSLSGVAHDAAVIHGDRGDLRIVFLTAGQQDTLASGYEMGICTRHLLAAWGFGVRSSVGLS